MSGANVVIEIGAQFGASALVVFGIGCRHSLDIATPCPLA
jgi:hypothetical protein